MTTMPATISDLQACRIGAEWAMGLWKRWQRGESGRSLDDEPAYKEPLGDEQLRRVLRRAGLERPAPPTAEEKALGLILDRARETSDLTGATAFENRLAAARGLHGLAVGVRNLIDAPTGAATDKAMAETVVELGGQCLRVLNSFGFLDLFDELRVEQGGGARVRAEPYR